MAEPHAPLTLDDVVRRIVRERRILAIVFVVAVVLAGVAGLLWPNRYEATATLTVEPVAVVDAGAETTVNMETEQVVATSTEVLSPAAEALGDVSVETLAAGLVVTVPRGSQVLEFSYTSASPSGAAETANAIAVSYREQRVANAEEIVRQATDNLSGRISELEGRLSTAEPGSAEARSLELQIQTLQERLALIVSNTFYPGSLVSPATTPTDATKPSMLIFLAGGAFLGLLVGAFAALLRRRADPVAASPDDQAGADTARPEPAPAVASAAPVFIAPAVDAHQVAAAAPAEAASPTVAAQEDTAAPDAARPTPKTGQPRAKGAQPARTSGQGGPRRSPARNRSKNGR